MRKNIKKSSRSKKRTNHWNKSIKGFRVKRSDGTIYENERMRWPSSYLGTFRYKDQVREDVREDVR